MANSVDLSTISKQLKNLATDRKISEKSAVEYIHVLKNGILNSENSNNIILLTKVLDVVPKSDAVFSAFDAELMEKLVVLAQDSETPNTVTRSVLRIWLTYLAGVLPITRTRGMFNTLLKTICENQVNCDLLLSMLTKTISLSDTRMNLNIVDFVAKVLYRIVESINSVSKKDDSFMEEENWLLNFLKSLYKNDFFGSLCISNGADEIESMTGLSGSMDFVSTWLKSKYIAADSVQWNECTQLSKEVGIHLDVNDKSGCFLLQILVIIGCLSNPKKALFKTLVECSMAEPFPLLQFISKLSASIQSDAKLKSIFSIWNTSLWYSLLNVSARCWLFSGARIEDNDDIIIFKLVKVALNWLSLQLIDCETNENIALLLDDVSNFKYEKLKKLQLKQLQKGYLSNWEDQVHEYKDMIHDQVISFVKDERYMELSKGCWVYAENPLDHQNYNKNWIFITLSPNSQSIIYKEFPKRLGTSRYPGIATVTTTPNIDKDGIKVDFKSISKVYSEELTVEKNPHGLITMTSQRMMVNRINILFDKGILSFYVNTNQLKNIWDHGLNMLLNNSNASDEVNFQLKQLEDIAIRTQLLSLDTKPESDEKSQNWDFSSFNTDFHYL